MSCKRGFNLVSFFDQKETNRKETSFMEQIITEETEKGNRSSKATLAMVFKLCQEAEKKWRRLRGFNPLQFVIDNKPSVNGVLVDKVA